MRTEEQLERRLAEPTEELVRDLAELDGDLMLLGIGGKMGPSMARRGFQRICLAMLRKKKAVKACREKLLKKSCKSTKNG